MSAWRVVPIVVLALLAVAGLACDRPPAPAAAASPQATPSPAASAKPMAGYRVIRRYPHDAAAFTQGLVVDGDDFLESLGLYGKSSLRRVDRATGKILKKTPVPSQYFAEGMTVLGNRIFQLTWKEGKGFLYDRASFRPLGTFAYTGEGWGLTNDGSSLILSDGTDHIRFLDPKTFRVTRTITVRQDGSAISQLNELEWIEGEIWANVWQSDYIVRISPKDGAVTGWIDLSGLLPGRDPGDDQRVLNGIAYEAKRKRLFVTGKLWPALFEVEIKTP